LRLLIIISQYLPAQTPNTLRWQPLAEHFIKQGHEVSVLTTLRTGHEEEAQIGKVKVYRAGHNTLMDKLYNLVGSKNRRNELSVGPPRNGPLFKLVQKLTDKIWRSSYWPDGSKLFLKPGIKMGKDILSKEGFTHIVSVGLPFSAHWIAKHLKETDSNLHWHMDIQDPFSYSKEFWVNNFSKYEQKNIAAEKEAFALADSISVTNERAKEKYLELFSNYNNKLSVIPPMFTESVAGSEAHTSRRDSSVDKYDMILDSEKVHLGYFGSFYEGVRSPMLFLRFLKYLHEQDPLLFDRVQFHFVGQMDRVTYPMFDLFPEVRRYIVLHGFKNRAQTLDAMSQVDIFMNFGNTTDYHLPSKVVDYLYINKPVLNFTSTKRDSTQAFMDNYDSILSLRLAIEHFEEQAKLFSDFVFRQKEKKEPSLSAVAPYTLETVYAAYESALG